MSTPERKNFPPGDTGTRLYHKALRKYKYLNGMMVDAITRDGKYKKQRRLNLASRPQSLKCELCGRETITVFDHCHTTNKFRGWLCNLCNMYLGVIDKDPDIIERIVEYRRIS